MRRLRTRKNSGAKVTADALSLAKFHVYGCNDYALVRSQRSGEDVFFVVSPADVVIVRPRDQADHIQWLVARERFEEALSAAGEIEKQHGSALDVTAIGLKYMHYLTAGGERKRRAKPDDLRGFLPCRLASTESLGQRCCCVGTLDICFRSAS